MSVTLVRHAESVANYQEILCGQLDISLTERGVASAREKLRSSLIAKGVIPYERAIYCSPLKRAIDSMFLSIGDGVVYEKDSRLMETNTGKFSNMSVNKVHDLHPWTLEEGRNFNYRYPDGESCEDVNKRMKSFIVDKVLKSSRDLLIFGHGGTLNHFAHILLGLNYDEYPAIKTVNTQVLTLDYDEGLGWSLVL